MGQMISRHNKQVLSKAEETAPKKPDCKCVPGNVIYQGAVTRKDTGETNLYTGLSEPSWKL